ncbi:MAG: ABC transporter substrate-binding protein [Acidimicrobiia bacterium]|nr:ABC transporter substrate-binding protein [Acidimicrobiia bacterium]
MNRSAVHPRRCHRPPARLSAAPHRLRRRRHQQRRRRDDRDHHRPRRRHRGRGRAPARRRPDRRTRGRDRRAGTPPATSGRVSGHFVGSAVYDTLAMFDEDGVAQPYLAGSFTPNDDSTQWEIGLREGVTFHDGTPLDAQAVVTNLEAYRASGLVGPALRPVETVEVADPATVRVPRCRSRGRPSPPPWRARSATWWRPRPRERNGLARSPSAPDRSSSRNGCPTTDSSPPGTRTTGRRASPDVDSVEFRPIIEAGQREDTLATGDLSMLHSSDVRSVEDLRSLADAGDIQLVEDGGIGEEGFIMLNLSEPPTDDIRVRRALAHAIDLEQYNEVVDVGVRSPARTPFIEGTPWYSQEAWDTYPDYDPAAATQLIQEYEAENGPVEIELQDTQGNDEELAFIQQAWEQVGVDVELTVTEQGVHIIDALGGDFQAVGWRLFGNPDPDGEYVWWDIENANPPPEIALNFARLRNEELQAAMNRGRATSDPDERKAAYDEAQTIINEELPYIWQNHTLWVFAGANDVRNMAWYELPDGTPGLGVYAGFPGATKLTDVWLDR